jgi:hypothetical protein
VFRIEPVGLVYLADIDHDTVLAAPATKLRPVKLQKVTVMQFFLGRGRPQGIALP